MAFIPDRKGRRFRTPIKSVLDQDLFKTFKLKYPKYNIDYSTFRKVIIKDNKKIQDLVIENRDGIELRESLGLLVIISCEAPQRSSIDFYASQKAGVKVLHKNWDTDNRTARIVYTNVKKCYYFQNKMFWGFKTCREFSEKVSKAFRKNYNSYIQLNSRTRVSTLIN